MIDWIEFYAVSAIFQPYNDSTPGIYDSVLRPTTCIVAAANLKKSGSGLP